jgi:hypothetical protein
VVYLLNLLIIQPIMSTTSTMMMTAVHMPALKISPITWQLVTVTARKTIKLKKYNLKFFIVFCVFCCAKAKLKP